MSKIPALLKNFDLNKSADHGWIALGLTGKDLPRISFTMSSDGFGQFINELVKFKIAAQVDDLLSVSANPYNAQETLPATECAMLIAKTVDLVRWKSDGAVLRAMTTDGMSIHLALSPGHEKFLLHALAFEPPK